MRLLSLVLLALLAALPARAESTFVLAALDGIPAEASFWGETRITGVVDFHALKEVSGLAEGVRFTDFAAHRLGEAEELAASSLLWRVYGPAQFQQYLLTGSETWPQQLGIDFFQLDWFSEAGTPPRFVLLLGSEALPRGEALSVLENAGLAPVERQGVTAWAKGENDNGIDVQHREPGFPFWGWLGSSVRLFRGEDALVGTRAWPDFDLALAVERGEAESLADLPRFRLAADAAAHADYSAGEVLQITFADQAFGAGVFPAAPDGLPPFELFAFADREDASGQQVVLVLTYGSDAETAAVAAGRVAAALDAWRDQGGKRLVERFPGLSIAPSVQETEDGAAAVVRLATPPEPVKAEGRVNNRSRLYAQILRMLYARDLAFLSPRG